MMEEHPGSRQMTHAQFQVIGYLFIRNYVISPPSDTSYLYPSAFLVLASFDLNRRFQYDVSYSYRIPPFPSFIAFPTFPEE
jgi:hypothetical protein